MNSYSSSFYKCPNLGVERSYIYKVDTYSWGMAWQDGGPAWGLHDRGQSEIQAVRDGDRGRLVT